MKTSKIKRNATCSFFLLWLGMTGTGWTATVTTNEAGMDAIYSQASFGSTTVEIRFNSSISINNHDLLTITTAQEEAALWALVPTDPSSVNMYFVDTVDYCGSYTVGLVGCSSEPWTSFVVESTDAAGANGAELNSHELGHVLGLSHEDPGLMNAGSWGDTTLTAAQVTTILGSALIQLDSGQRYVSITPILVTPIPAALPLLLSAIGLLTVFNWRRHTT